MNTGQLYPHSMTKEYISGRIVLDPTTRHYIFQALNVSNNFATFDFDAHVNTKIDYSIKRVFRSMTA